MNTENGQIDRHYTYELGRIENQLMQINDKLVRISEGQCQRIIDLLESLHRPLQVIAVLIVIGVYAYLRVNWSLLF